MSSAGQVGPPPDRTLPPSSVTSPMWTRGGLPWVREWLSMSAGHVLSARQLLLVARIARRRPPLRPSGRRMRRRRRPIPRPQPR